MHKQGFKVSLLCLAATALVAVAPAAAVAAPVETVTADELGPIVPPAHTAASTITMSGSTSVYPLAIDLATAYNRQTGTKFRILQGGSDIGVSDVAAGRVTIGNASRDPVSSDPGGLKFNKIARDAICMITNSKNRIRNLSRETAAAIFSGKVKDWSKVPGATVKGSIDVNVRTAASGTQDSFQKLVIGRDAITGSASQRATSGQIVQAVRSNANAIGYVSLDYDKGTNPAAFQGVACNLRNAKAGQYRATRNFWMITRGAPKGDAAKFIKFARSQKRTVGAHWVPV